MTSPVTDDESLWDVVAAHAVGTCQSFVALSERFDVDESKVEEELGKRCVETCVGCGWWFAEPVGAVGDPLCEDCR